MANAPGACVVAAAVMVFIMGCIAPDVPDQEEPEGEPVSTRELDRGTQSGHREAVERVVATQEEWDAFWQSHQGASGDEAPPTVDFATERVIAVALGERPNGCYSVQIGQVTHHEDTKETRVDYTETQPGPDSVCTQALVYPYHFIAVPDDGSPVEFRAHQVKA